MSETVYFTDIKKETFTFLWGIENFHLLPQKNGKCLISPEFCVKSFEKTKWVLQLYPKGCSEDSEFVSCYLKRQEDDDGPEEIKIDLRLSLNSTTFHGVGTYKKGKVWGYQIIKEISSVKDNNYVIVQATMQLNQEDESATVSKGQNLLPCIPQYLEMDSLTSELAEKIYSEMERRLEKVHKSAWICPTYCFAKSKVLMESRSVTCPLDDLFKTESKRNTLNFPVVSFSQVPSVLITLQKKRTDGEDSLQIEVSFLEDLENEMLSFCNLNLLTTNGEIFKSLEDRHSFLHGYGHDVWIFSNPIKWSSINEKGVTSLRFDFQFSSGQILSNIEWSSDVNYSSNDVVKPLPSEISNELYRFYTEKKFCDVILEVEDEKFHTHKTVLCAASSVFTAMFDSGMTECETNIIHINDMDSDTIGAMLEYIYTEHTEQWSFDMTIKLYSAADKYALKNLKLKCRCLLSNDLNTNNICDILGLADLHHDNILKKSAVDFIYIHKKDIILSKKWKELSNKNISLAHEILFELCLK